MFQFQYILVIYTIIQIILKVSNSDTDIGSKFCQLNGIDFAFNFYDEYEHPNGIALIKNQFSCIYNEGLIESNFINTPKDFNKSKGK